MVLFYTNSHFEYIFVPFERISLINCFSLVLPGGWGFGAFSHVSFAAFFSPEGGDFAPSKKIPGGRPGGRGC